MIRHQLELRFKAASGEIFIYRYFADPQGVEDVCAFVLNQGRDSAIGLTPDESYFVGVLIGKQLAQINTGAI
ncbi:hypothetical protein [Roseiconus lacunae]|uniref:hypothetical protein n=1 Tax=Roseiconus lacunae TaxID=2605694 RepID=UPI001E34E239|nr:hypothetical protein [Roseiconus lacunae]MCD0459139.1 hypothetical protein [Roseiconus lacunae]